MKCFLLHQKTAPYVCEMFIEERIDRLTASRREVRSGH